MTALSTAHLAYGLEGPAVGTDCAASSSRVNSSSSSLRCPKVSARQPRLELLQFPLPYFALPGFIRCSQFGEP